MRRVGIEKHERAGGREGDEENGTCEGPFAGDAPRRGRRPSRFERRHVNVGGELPGMGPGGNVRSDYAKIGGR